MSELVTKKELLAKLKSELDSNSLNTYIFSYEAKYGLANRPIFTKTPQPMAIPYSWKYRKVKELLNQVASLLTLEESERRNATMVNPGLKDIVSIATTPTIYSSFQVLKPGDEAIAHRHTVDAFRFVVEAPHEKAYTVVNGVKVNMREGDLILTPDWAWHGHRNEGDSDVYFMTGQNAILIYWIGASFYENYEEVTGSKFEPILYTDREILSYFEGGLVPSGGPFTVRNPLIYYPYERMRKALFSLYEKVKDPQIVVDYVNPIDGGSPLPGMRINMRLIRPKSSTRLMRRTENSVFCTFRGEAKFELPEQKKEFKCEPYDVVVLPSWTQYRIVNDTEEPAILFSYSDEPVFRFLGVFREEQKSG
jgi:gentisate 1,2-dioxygenase